MKPGDLVRIKLPLSDRCAGKIGLFVEEVDLETYFNPICVFVDGGCRYYGLDELEPAAAVCPK